MCADIASCVTTQVRFSWRHVGISFLACITHKAFGLPTTLGHKIVVFRQSGLRGRSDRTAKCDTKCIQSWYVSQNDPNQAYSQNCTLVWDAPVRYLRTKSGNSTLGHKIRLKSWKILYEQFSLEKISPNVCRSLFGSQGCFCSFLCPDCAGVQPENRSAHIYIYIYIYIYNKIC